MIILAAALTLGINLEIDLSALLNRRRAARTQEPTVSCGIKVVGYHFTGRKDQQFRYGGETFTIPMEGYVEVISMPRVQTYVADGVTFPLGDDRSAMDGFSFRWIDLPTAAMQGGGR
jgi:hypothetical protein